MSQRSAKPATESVDQQNQIESEGSPQSTGQKSLKDLLFSNIAQKCDFKDKLDEIDMQGTTYVAGGKFRSDFTSRAGETTTNGHMIYADKTSYVWTEGELTGFKMHYDPEEVEATQSSNTQQSVDPNKTIDYSCSVWLPSNSTFTPPANIKFTEYTVPVTPQTQSQENQTSCSVCDSLSGEQKTQCRTALKCD